MTKTLTKADEVTALFNDLDKPSLHALSYALRHPDTWPEGFNWNYKKCDTCAMGLAHLLWKNIPEVSVKDAASVMARKFAMPFAVSKDIFLGDGTEWIPRVRTGALWWSKNTQDFDSVTPEMVADQIDAYLANAE